MAAIRALRLPSSVGVYQIKVSMNGGIALRESRLRTSLVLPFNRHDPKVTHTFVAILFEPNVD